MLSVWSGLKLCCVVIDLKAVRCINATAFSLLLQVWIGFPIFFLIICLFLIITPLTNGPMECLMGILVVSTGIPVYIIGVKWKSKPEVFQTYLGKPVSYEQSLQQRNK